MSRHSAIRAAVAAATLAALLAGCALHPGPGHRPGNAQLPLRSGELITEPGQGFSPVYQLIAQARRSIDLTMFELADPRAEKDLVAAASRGVDVRVVLDQRERSTNTAAYQFLRASRVHVVWSSASYEYTHQKTLVTDGSRALIMTANLTSRYYPSTRDFLYLDSNRADVAASTRVFAADYAHRAIRPSNGRDLVWSPGGSQDQLLALISNARYSLRIYSEEMSDTKIEEALAAAARRGVSVQVCGENQDGEYDRAFATLAAAGVRISYYSSGTGFYVHGKVIEADYGTPRARAFLGSENFSVTSLTRNRELGLIFSGAPALESITRTFAADFRRGTHWPATG